eukprot:278524-Hanusia_phi.AAC.5
MEEERRRGSRMPEAFGQSLPGGVVDDRLRTHDFKNRLSRSQVPAPVPAPPPSSSRCRPSLLVAPVVSPSLRLHAGSSGLLETMRMVLPTRAPVLFVQAPSSPSSFPTCLPERLSIPSPPASLPNPRDVSPPLLSCLLPSFRPHFLSGYLSGLDNLIQVWANVELRDSSWHEQDAGDTSAFQPSDPFSPLRPHPSYPAPAPTSFSLPFLLLANPRTPLSRVRRELSSRQSLNFLPLARIPAPQVL